MNFKPEVFQQWEREVYSTVSTLCCIDSTHYRCPAWAWHKAAGNTGGGIVAREGHESHHSLAAFYATLGTVRVSNKPDALIYNRSTQVLNVKYLAHTNRNSLWLSLPIS